MIVKTRKTVEGLKGLEALHSIRVFLDEGELEMSYELNIIEKALKALEIISNISKHTYHFKLGGRRNFGEDKISYYLIIAGETDECEYKLKSKEEYEILREVLL